MKPTRFLIFFLLAYGIGLLISLFLLFSSRILQEPNLIFASMVIVVILTGLFGWLYFRGVKSISWRAKFEAIGVWMGLVILLDMILLYAIFGGSVKDVNWLYIGGLSMQLLTLFLAAYITAIDHPRISSPDLQIKTEA